MPFRPSRAVSAAGRAILDKLEESERRANRVSRDALSALNRSLDTIDGSRADQQSFFSSRRQIKEAAVENAKAHCFKL